MCLKDVLLHLSQQRKNNAKLCICYLAPEEAVSYLQQAGVRSKE